MKIEKSSVLDEVLPEDYFELCNGEIVRSLRDLAVALEKMSDDDFRLHVYGKHNDFAEWILEAYWDEVLAGKILGVDERKKIIEVLRKFLEKAEAEKYDKIVAPRNEKDVLKSIGGME